MSEDGRVTTAGLRKVMVQACKDEGGQGAWARKHGISPSIVSETVNGKRDPSPEVAAALGFMRPNYFIPTKARKTKNV